MAKKITTEEFIKKARIVHGDKYDYSKVEYVKSILNVKIICPIHGDFLQTPHKHLRPSGCSECGRISSIQKRRSTTEKFIQKAKIIHGDKYDYSKVNYVDSETKLIIGCPIHGDYLQRPTVHLDQSGCPECGNIRTANSRRSTKEEFIEKSRKVHGDKYDYSKVNYKNRHTKVTIDCKIHGDFLQTPSSHLSGCGCPNCSDIIRGLNIRSTTEKFIQKAKLVHGDKYDYSKVNYIDCETKVTIGCSIHGDYLQIPSNHYSGRGCKKCSDTTRGLNSRLTAEEFIEKARIVHGDKYDYSKVEYKYNNIKVIIGCSIHGDFSQNPSSHLSGSECAKCKGGGKITTEEFIKKARIVHGEKYDYSKVEYINSLLKIIICCPDHGDFLQTPSSHLRDHGCGQCAGVALLTTEEFIEKARIVHGDKYDYSKVEYVKSILNVKIICPIHGDFLQTPHKHLSKCGCPECGGSKQLTTEKFIKRSQDIYGNKYDYSKVEYKNVKSKVIIGCKIHGDFSQLPSNHYRYEGCSSCAKEKMYPRWIQQVSHKQRKSQCKHVFTLYLIKCWDNNTEFYKIGVTSKLVQKRFGKVNQPSIHMPYKYEIIDKLESIDCRLISYIEKHMKKIISTSDTKKTFNVNKGDIIFGGSVTECFNIGLLETMKKYIEYLKIEEPNMINILGDEIHDYSYFDNL